LQSNHKTTSKNEVFVSAIVSRTVVPKLFLIVFHLRVPYCHHLQPCFRKSICQIWFGQKFGKSELMQMRHEQNGCEKLLRPFFETNKGSAQNFWNLLAEPNK